MNVCGFILIISLSSYYFSARASNTVEEIVCVYMKSCVLPCRFTPGSDLYIQWTQRDRSQTVHRFRPGQNQYWYQYPGYRGRTSLFKEEMNRGNASLLLRDVTLRDQGRFLCWANDQETYVNMKVFAPVSQVHMLSGGTNLYCHAHDIYPKPSLKWTMNPGPSAEPQTSVNPSETGLFSVYSFVPRPTNPPYEYTCTVSTEHSTNNKTYKRTRVETYEKKHVKTTDVEILCVYMKSCVLPCDFSPGSDLDIRWRKVYGYRDPIVHSFHQGQKQNVDQDLGYRGRTSLFEEEMNRGNASLLLKEVTVEDQGWYLCRANDQVTHVNMKVFAPVLEVHVNSTDENMICEALDIYPEPSLKWTMNPEPPAEPQTSVNRSETGLFFVYSSVRLSPDTPYEYTCTVSTEHSTKSMTYEETSVKTTERAFVYSPLFWVIICLPAVIAALLVFICYVKCKKRNGSQAISSKFKEKEKTDAPGEASAGADVEVPNPEEEHLGPNTSEEAETEQ